MQSLFFLAVLAATPSSQDPSAVFDAAVIELDVDVPPFRRVFDFDDETRRFEIISICSALD